jgi:hypothetical protein
MRDKNILRIGVIIIEKIQSMMRGFPVGHFEQIADIRIILPIFKRRGRRTDLRIRSVDTLVFRGGEMYEIVLSVMSVV